MHRDLQARRDFNTSHVSINHSPDCLLFHGTSISIHLMFLLIGNEVLAELLVRDFNTSHVSINQVGNGIFSRRNRISIHLMFLLIFTSWFINRFIMGISIHLMFLLIDPAYGYAVELDQFQYISCFY